MTRQELNRQSAVCKRCKDGYYCTYHAAWNGFAVAMEGHAMIRHNLAMRQPEDNIQSPRFRNLRSVLCSVVNP